MDRRSNFAFLLFCLVFPAFFFSTAFPSICLAENVTLGWDSNSEPDLEGYVIYRNAGSPGPPYKYADELPEDELQNPLSPTVTITGLKEDTRYYIAVTAYDTQGNESHFSDQLCLQILDSLIESCGVILSAPSNSSESSGGSSSVGGCFIGSAAGDSDPSRRMTAIVILFLMMLVVRRLLSVVKAKQLTNNNGPLKEFF